MKIHFYTEITLTFAPLLEDLQSQRHVRSEGSQVERLALLLLFALFLSPSTGLLQMNV